MNRGPWALLAPPTHLQEEDVIQLLLWVVIVLKQAADAEPLLGGLGGLQAVGPEHHAHQQRVPEGQGVHRWDPDQIGRASCRERV